jgi:transcription initiation factor TFIID subunit 7
MEQQPHNAVQIELENQLLIRLPQEPAEALREAIRSGASNLKERLFMQMEPDKPNNPFLRRGNVKFDGWTMSAKLVDLPTIMETHKTIDRKTLYKTADICQMFICKEGEPSEDELVDEEFDKKKDGIKVDKKFVHPHGLCPPLKNCRKRRFRKTLKKKHCLDEPEIEKEVKRLFRTDNEAVDVKWQLLTEEELNAGKGGSGDGRNDTNLGEQDLFGALSDIEEDDDGGLDRSDRYVSVATILTLTTEHRGRWHRPRYK